jgi:predicted secreted protein
MREKRRLLLKGLLGITTMATAMTAMPRLAMAKWSKAFDSSSVDGAVVPVTVKTKMANVTKISIFAEKNPQPLAASFTLPEGTAADVSIRIRLGESQIVKAVVEADGKLYTTEQEVKVTIGGCGG